jgi:hypothetical protein
MGKGVIVVLLITIFVWIWASIANSQTPQSRLVCGTRTSITDQLKENYGEKQTDIAYSNTGEIMEVYRGDESWSVVWSNNVGTRACIMAAGTVWKHTHKGEKKI